MSRKAQYAYWLWKIKRERGLFVLAAIFALLFVGLYYIHTTGFWAATKNPPEFVFGTLVKIWQPPVAEDPTYLTLLQVKLEDGSIVQLGGPSKLILDCSIGDKVELLKHTNDSDRSYFRVGPAACFDGS